MSNRPITRRNATILLASLPLVARAATSRPGTGIEIRFTITRQQRQPSGDIASRTFENAMLMASGETMEVDFRDQFRVNLQATDAGDAASVRLRLWDNKEEGDLNYAGDGMVNVPIGGQATLTLLKSDNVQYVIALKATHRPLA